MQAVFEYDGMPTLQVPCLERNERATQPDLAYISLYLAMALFTFSCLSAGTRHMHVSMVAMGPPRHGNKGFKKAGACSAAWSSIFFLDVLT